MKVQCPCCQAIVPVDDEDVKNYVKKLKKPASEAKRLAASANGKKSRPGSIGNQRAKKKQPE